jgi:hypothetical protein
VVRFSNSDAGQSMNTTGASCDSSEIDS